MPSSFVASSSSCRGSFHMQSSSFLVRSPVPATRVISHSFGKAFIPTVIGTIQPSAERMPRRLRPLMRALVRLRW